MKRKVLAILLFLTLGHTLVQAGQKIVAIQSVSIGPYDQAIKGFTSVGDFEIKRLVLSELRGMDIVKKIDEIGPDIVLTIGPDALLKAKSIQKTPVVYLMVLDPQSILSGERNVTGVSMNISPKQQLATLLQVLPDVENIGLLYDPAKTREFVQRARVAAEKIGIRLYAKEVNRPSDIPSLISDMKGKIDLFWMLPDVTVITPETVKFLLLFSLENKIPVLTFSEKYVELGTPISIGIDAFDIGCQAGEMVKRILSGTDVKDVQPVDARKEVISISPKIARKLGIRIDEKIIWKARIVN